MTKRKFSKLLGKQAVYTATRQEYDNYKDRILLKDVKHKGKLYSDHIWTKVEPALERIDIGQDVCFNATGYMYNDKFGTRKQGLNRCHDYHIFHKEYTQEDSGENLKHMRRRIDKGLNR